MDAGIVKFNVGGQIFEMLEQTVRAKPETLLCTLLDDPARSKDASAPVFVEADPGLFGYIMAWYRYGSICLPHNISLEEMQRECAFYQLPDGLSIKQECVRPHQALKVLQDVAAKAKERVTDTKAGLLAAGIYVHFLEQGSTGQGNSVRVDKDFCEKHELPPLSSVTARRACEHLLALAEPDGWKAAVSPKYNGVPLAVEYWEVQFKVLQPPKRAACESTQSLVGRASQKSQRNA
mmetsp:Transcript_21257/g.47630  ORF Transcript_21257/g.47630 Transcript_21257/m.47630 type:complete len:235 (-) Transcript_21257:61-765(-)